MSNKTKTLSLFFLVSVLVVANAANLVFANKNTNLKVGTYVYTWYDTLYASNWEYPKIVDKPVLGYYNSCDTDVILTQINQIEDLGIDYVLLNWMGFSTFSNAVVYE